MEVLGISPIQRLVVPRVLAMTVTAVVLNGLATVSVSAAATSSTSSSRAGRRALRRELLRDRAGLRHRRVRAQGRAVRLHRRRRRGLPRAQPAAGREGVGGDAVNQAVVISFVLVFLINLVLTALYLQIVPPKGGSDEHVFRHPGPACDARTARPARGAGRPAVALRPGDRMDPADDPPLPQGDRAAAGRGQFRVGRVDRHPRHRGGHGSAVAVRRLTRRTAGLPRARLAGRRGPDRVHHRVLQHPRHRPRSWRRRP